MDWVSIPSVMTFVGAILVAAGTLWSAARQSAKSDEIAALNRDLAAKSDEITRLTKDNLGAVTGGDSFCYIYPSSLTSEPGSEAVVVHVGKYPLYDVEIRLIGEKPADYRLTLPPDIAARQPVFHSRNSVHRTIRPQSLEGSFMLGPFSAEVERFTISFTARNGSWTQYLTVRKGGTNWNLATKVIREEAGVAYPRPIFERVEPGFPVDSDGNVQW